MAWPLYITALGEVIMKLHYSVLLVLLWAPAGLAQVEDIEFQKLEAERTIVNADAAREDAEEAKLFAAKEKEQQALLRAEANQAIRDAKKLETQALRETARSRKEGEKAQAANLEYKKQVKEAMARKEKAERTIRETERSIAKAQARREDFKNQKTLTLKKSKELTLKVQNNAKALQEATKAARVAELEARSAKAQLKVAQMKYDQAKRMNSKKLMFAKNTESKYKADITKSKKAKRHLDKSLAMLPEE